VVIFIIDWQLFIDSRSLLALTLLLDELGDEARPTGLMACADAGSILAMEIFMEWDVITPMRIILKGFIPAKNGAPTSDIAAEQVDQSRGDFIGDLIQSDLLARMGGVLDEKVIAVVMVKLLERFDNQIVDREPDRPAPVGISAKQAALRFGRLIRHGIGRSIHV
jgi:hypothetical protein